MKIETIEFKELGIILYKINEKGRYIKDKFRYKMSYEMIEKYYRVGYKFKDEFAEQFLSMKEVKERFKDHLKVRLELKDLIESRFMSNKHIDFYESGLKIKEEAPQWVKNEYKNFMSGLIKD